MGSRLVLGPCHTKDCKNGSGPCLHGTRHKVGATNMTGRPGVSFN